jgi:TonB dependent receptor/Carboxypeptidase regulatory-like domain
MSSASRQRLAYLSVLAIASYASGQTSSTGALMGVTLDPGNSIVPEVTLHLVRLDGAKDTSSISDDNGRFAFLLLSPGTYELHASKSDFEPLKVSELHIVVTETLQLEVHLRVATRIENADVFSEPTMVQTDTSALGRVVNENAAKGLPLATRNFAQIAALSPGVITGVYNAGELGNGAIALSQIGVSNDGIYVHGARSYDNNWQLDGISVSDVLSTSSASGGIPIPNPDALQEFKVQTGLYDAAFGRAAGSNISVVTKNGTNHYHGSVFEFLRNEVFNANDYFLNQIRQRRPPLRQNQFGFAIGGPIQTDRLLFFASYQGTRQINGIAAGQTRVACTASLHEPPLTNDRSPAALGSLFGGMKGALGGVAVNRDGSNINPVALALLNFKLPDGNYLIPTPQAIDPSAPVANQGFSVFAEPCRFNEDQFLVNLGYTPSAKNQFAVHFFLANDNQLVTFPGNGMNSTGNTAGFSSPGTTDFFVSSLAYTHVLSSNKLNEAKVGFVRTSSKTGANSPFAWSDVGVAEGTMNEANELPNLLILGSLSMAPAFPRTYTQDSFVVSDVFSVLKAAHAFQFGGSVTRLLDPLHFAGFPSFVEFLSWPDFLLGLNATGNGTGSFSNVFESADAFGLFNREFNAWEVSGFAQDTYRVDRSLTLNVGLRYERPGQFGDKLGRNSSFDISRADATPSPSGSLDGYIVASNFPGILPPGVVRAHNRFGTYGDGQNTIAPRIGFAWRVLPQTSRLALRGGYGIYYSRPTGQSFTASVLAPPFGLTRTSTGPANGAATFQAPFAQPFPTATSFPMFAPYSPTTKSSVNTLAPNFRPAMAQQFSLNVQAELRRDWLLELGYVGTRSTHLQRFRSLNQALDVSPNDPIRGVTSNTLANVGLRVPVPGIRPDALREIESEGTSWYNGLEASLTKRLSNGLEFLASYTFSKTLDTDGANVNGTSAANTLTLGDQNSPRQRWGRASTDRTHRFVLSDVLNIPSPAGRLRRAILGEWALTAVATIQSGSALTIADTNADNVFGISEDRAQLTGKCTKNQLVTGGSPTSKLNSYFHASCFTTPPVIGADGIGTGFGDSATGIVDGPAQANLDIALSKAVRLNRPVENGTIQFRAEFFNALNHPQFANPDTNFTSPTFGVISSTAVNPRVGQLAITLAF